MCPCHGLRAAGAPVIKQERICNQAGRKEFESKQAGWAKKNEKQQTCMLFYSRLESIYFQLAHNSIFSFFSIQKTT